MTPTVYPLLVTPPDPPPRARVKLSEVMGRRRRPPEPDPDVEPADFAPTDTVFVPIGTPPAPSTPNPFIV